MQEKDFTTEFIKIENEIKKNIVGQEEIIRHVLVAIIVRGNVLLEGLPGLGKTRLIKTIGNVLELQFSRIQFTPDLMPGDVTGTDIFNKNSDSDTGNFRFQKGPIFTNILLADEINRATPKTQSALLEAMQEQQVTVGGRSHMLDDPFFVLATQNPIELEGTYPLPEAQLDRFLMKLLVEFPSKSEIFQIIGLTTGSETENLNKVSDGTKIVEMSHIAMQVPIATAVAEYAVDVIMRLHPELPESPELVKKYVRYGSSPRGAQALIKISKVLALLDDRFNVSFEDIKKAALPALRHRIFLNFDALSDGITEDYIIKSVL